MTLHDKALFYEDQVRSRHIRNGFNASLDGLTKGNLATGYMSDSDNDGLWTAMYLGGEIFRYAVTKDKDALQNCRESLDAMERLYTINPVPGFAARSFERAGYIKQLHDPDRWQHSPQPGWDWKATTSSDEIIGHIFAFGAMAELVDDKDLQRRSITLIDTVMSHILTHNLYLIDYDGKPTMWGKWHPDYVNSFPTNVGDRKLNSSNIVAMLQTAYHFTKKEKYRQKALELMQKHGYLENLMRPMRVIGQAPENADAHSKNMSESAGTTPTMKCILWATGACTGMRLTTRLKAKYQAGHSGPLGSRTARKRRRLEYLYGPDRHQKLRPERSRLVFAGTPAGPHRLGNQEQPPERHRQAGARTSGIKPPKPYSPPTSDPFSGTTAIRLRWTAPGAMARRNIARATSGCCPTGWAGTWA